MADANHYIIYLACKLLAYHQAGHAVVRWFSENAAKAGRVSINACPFKGIIDRNKACTKKMLFDETCALLGGGAGEKLLLFDGDKSTTDMDDNRAATTLAYHQATRYGFSDSVDHLSLDNEGSQGCYGQEIQAMINNVAKEWLGKAGKRAEKLVLHHRELVVWLAELLLQDEVVQYEVLVEVLTSRYQRRSFQLSNGPLLL